jgi:hypothetical protein
LLIQFVRLKILTGSGSLKALTDITQLVMEKEENRKEMVTVVWDSMIKVWNKRIDSEEPIIVVQNADSATPFTQNAMNLCDLIIHADPALSSSWKDQVADCKEKVISLAWPASAMMLGRLEGKLLEKEEPHSAFIEANDAFLQALEQMEPPLSDSERNEVRLTAKMYRVYFEKEIKAVNSGKIVDLNMGKLVEKIRSLNVE